MIAFALEPRQLGIVFLESADIDISEALMLTVRVLFTFLDWSGGGVSFRLPSKVIR